MMKTEHVGESAANYIANYLEGLRLLDQAALASLVKARVPCNDILAESNLVTVKPRDEGGWELGLLGIVNGLLLNGGSQHIVVAAYDDENTEGPIAGFFATPAGERQ